MSNNIIRKIYREKDIKQLQTEIDMLGGELKIDAVQFFNIRNISTVVIFIVLLYILKFGYIIAPLVAVLYFYAFYYVLITRKLRLRTLKLDHEALYFFEILTLTLESGRNLESALEITCNNVDSEISGEFKKTLLEIKFGKSLMEALENMKNRIPSETINNIILSMIQTSVFGNSIIGTMHNQIDFLRDKQILEIKGQINKIPNKVSIISVVFIVPIILLLILGPFLLEFIG